MKRMIAILTAALLALGGAALAAADVEITVNGETLPLEGVIVVGDTVYVSIGEFAQAMGGTCEVSGDAVVITLPGAAAEAGTETEPAPEAEPAAEIAGVWTAQLSNGVTTLTLNDDATGTLEVGSSVYDFEWTLEGDALTLIQNGSAISAVYDGACIKLDVAGNILTFNR